MEAWAGVLTGCPWTASPGEYTGWRLAARTGGDEFFLLLPGTENAGALAMAEGIRTAITDLAIPHPASPIAAVVTLSFGVATTIPTPGADANQFIARADQALYHSKRQGRNPIGGS